MMGQTGSPNSMIQGQTCTPIVEKTWKKRDTLKQAKISFTWALVNIVLAFFVFLDMIFSIVESILEAKYSFIWYIDLTLLVIFVLNVATDLFRYLSNYLFGRQVEITERQKQLLGVRDNDPGFQLSPQRAPSPSSDGSLIFSSTPPAGSPYSPSSSPWSSLGGHATPTNLGSFSGSYSYVSPSNSFTSNQSGHVSFDRNASLPGHNLSYSPNLSFSPSLAYSPGASLSSLDTSGMRSRLSLSSSYRSPSPSDNITDVQSLSMYLKDQEEKEYKASLSSPDLSFSNQSFWSYGRPSLDYTHFLRKNQYQLASRSPQSVRSRSEDTDNMGEEVWGPLGVTDDDLYIWIERLRKWIGQTVMVKLSMEIGNINAGLRKIGCQDTEIGEVGVSTLKQLALTKGPYVPTLNVIVPYLDFSSNQEYLVKRLKDLGSDGCMSEFSWASGGQFGKQWGEHLPTDAGIVMHMLCCYLDSRLPAEIKYPDGKVFTNQYFLKTPDKPDLGKKDNLLIYQSSINPPHFQVVVKNTLYNLPKGRNNMFHAILFFLYHVKKEYNGMLGRVNLGMSGVNILWVLDTSR